MVHCTTMKRIVWAALLIALLPFVAQRSATQDLQNTNHSNQKRSALIARLSTTEKLSRRTAEAFDAVPRERFLPSYLENMAYEDSSLPLGKGQTLPSPSDLLRAVQALDVQPADTVLVIGASTGYLAALLSRLASSVYDVELVENDRANSRQLFSTLGFSNITVSNSALVDIFSSRGPFDRIFIHGATTEVPQTVFAQLSPTGRMIVPLRDPTGFQMVVELSRSGGNMTMAALGKGFYSPIQLSVGR